MTTRDLFQEIETLSQAQLESVYSFVYLLKNLSYLKGSSNQEPNIEPFASENEAIDFANYCAKKVLNETWWTLEIVTVEKAMLGVHIGNLTESEMHLIAGKLAKVLKIYKSDIEE